jgi:VanZ family protein
MSRFLQTPTRIIPMLLVMGIIYFFSSVPGERLILPNIVNIDKVAHMAEYGLLALTVFHAFGAGFGLLHPRLAPLLVILICTMYGVTDEFHQSFVPNRSSSIFDILADSTGAIIVCFISSANTNLRKKRSSGYNKTSICF